MQRLQCIKCEQIFWMGFDPGEGGLLSGETGFNVPAPNAAGNGPPLWDRRVPEGELKPFEAKQAARA
jgi:hypothetical protein